MLKLHENILATDKHIHSRVKNPAFGDASLPSDVVIGPQDDDPPDPQQLMEYYSPAVIYEKVKRVVCSLRRRTLPIVQDSFDPELVDIAQKVHIHFWQKLEEKQPILNPEAYLTTMIIHQCYDEARKYAREGKLQLFSMMERESVYEAKALIEPGAGMADPALEHGRKYDLASLLHRIAFAISKLPPRQKLAMTCELLEKGDNLAWIIDALTIYGVNTEVQWPQDKKAKQKLQASLPPARNAIAARLHIDISEYIHKKRCKRRSSINA